MTEFKINSKNSQNQLKDILEGKTHTITHSQTKSYQKDKPETNLI